MRKNVLFIALCLYILLGACQTHECENIQFPTEIKLFPNHEIIPAGTYVPESMTEKDGVTFIDFQISARRYSISFDDDTSRMGIQLISKS